MDTQLITKPRHLALTGASRTWVEAAAKSVSQESWVGAKSGERKREKLTPTQDEHASPHSRTPEES